MLHLVVHFVTVLDRPEPRGSYAARCADNIAQGLGCFALLACVALKFCREFCNVWFCHV